MGWSFKFFDPPPMIPNEITIVRPQHVLVSDGDGWHQRVLYKGADGTLWVHGFRDLEWLELSADGSVKEAFAKSRGRRWREMPTMLDHPVVRIVEKVDTD